MYFIKLSRVYYLRTFCFSHFTYEISIRREATLFDEAQIATGLSYFSHSEIYILWRNWLAYGPAERRFSLQLCQHLSNSFNTQLVVRRAMPERGRYIGQNNHHKEKSGSHPTVRTFFPIFFQINSTLKMVRVDLWYWFWFRRGCLDEFWLPFDSHTSFGHYIFWHFLDRCPAFQNKYMCWN